jgi:prepilin-type N-terminal cleavage/methylation domain-containing protein
MIRLTKTTTRRPTGPRRPVMVDRRRGPTTDNGRRTTDERGFTLVELLVVIVVLGILIALLLPAINGALRTSREAAVSAEINALGQALAQFKSTYGDYPPSRIYLAENGDYSVANVSVGAVSVSTIDPTSPGGANDITVAQLAARTLQAFRKFWPRAQFSVAGPVFAAGSHVWYDFNGNGQMDPPYVLHGHECLVFFLGGIPSLDPGTGTYGLNGFGSDPTNPFSNNIVGNPMYNTNRKQPLFQFNPGRLFPDSNNVNPTTKVPVGVPAYYDTLNVGPPSTPYTGAGPVNFYVYFSAYGNGNYDPNDVNIPESDSIGNVQEIALGYAVTFPIQGAATLPPVVGSWSPNPYTTTLTANTSSGNVTYQTAQTFQIISAGSDGLYGVGGQYVPQSQSSTVALPWDGTHTNSTDGNIRQREYDNLTNFKSGRLQ